MNGRLVGSGTLDGYVVMGTLLPWTQVEFDCRRTGGWVDVTALTGWL